MWNFLHSSVSINTNMLWKQFFISLFLSVLWLNLFIFDVQGQKRKHKTVKNISKISKNKILSFGVINGKAINLVRPEYSPSARFVKVKGLVSILVLIDENGQITKATALKGHPLLIPGSLKAALESTFEPITLQSGEKVKVSGVIVYNYISDTMNWLELGFNSDSVENLEKFLPIEFDKERELLSQSKNLFFNEQIKFLETVNASIENNLITNSKSLWLFSVGKNVKLLLNNHWKLEIKKQGLDNIQNLLLSKPENISPLLIKNLEGLAKVEENLGFNELLINLSENLFSLGN